MPQHASHSIPARRPKRALVAGIVGGALLVATLAALALVAAQHAEAPSYATDDALAPSFAGALNGTARACELPAPAAPTEREPYAPTAADIAALPSQQEPFAFNLNAASVDASPVLADETAAALQTACAPLAEGGWNVGYLLLDLDTGRGLASNLDAASYGASAFKALYALYLCETQLDTEHATLDTPCPEYAATAFMDPAGTYRYDDLASYPLGMLIEDSITASDNDSYRILRANYDAEFPAYLADQGFSASLADDWYPTYHTREAGLLWLHAAAYLASDAPSAAWLGALLQQTETSFIRDALAPQRVVVQDKAGWYADDDPAYCGINDAGIVTVDGRTYLLCLMSSAPYSSENADALTTLAATVFAAREDLA